MSDHDQSHPTVLIVEDHEDIRVVTRALLEKLSQVRVLEATDGEAAIEVAERERPDLILMDLSLPRVDGFEATKQIRSNIHTRDIPIVAWSAFCWDRTWQKKALNYGCDACYEKKPEHPALQRILQRHVAPR